MTRAACCFIATQDGPMEAVALAYRALDLGGDSVVFVLTEPMGGCALAVTEYSTGLRLPGPLLDELDDEVEDGTLLTQAEAQYVLDRKLREVIKEQGLERLARAIAANRQTRGYTLNEHDF